MAIFFQKLSVTSKNTFVTSSPEINTQNNHVLVKAKEELDQAIEIQGKILKRIYELRNKINDLELKMKQMNIPKFLFHPIKQQKINIERELDMWKTKLDKSQLCILIATRDKEIEKLSLTHRQQRY